MNPIELALAVAAFALGARSLVHWLRRPFEARGVAEHALFALFVMARAGLWAALGFFFLISASVGATYTGLAYMDEMRFNYWWYPMTFLVLGAVQFLTTFFLRRRVHAPAQGTVSPNSRTGSEGSESFNGSIGPR